MNNILELRQNAAIKRLKNFSNSLQTKNNRAIEVILTKNMSIGEGNTRNFDSNKSHIRVGINNLFESSILHTSHVDDLAFTRTVITLYHEYGHYLQNYGTNKHIPSMISEVSVVHNITYYKHAWKELPHEINAEKTGINLAWTTLEKAFPGKSNKCMLEYVNFRAENTSYMIPAKQGGYQSYEEIMDAFETAMDKSLTRPRIPQGRFLRYNDESIRLLTQGYDNYLRSPNAYHAGKLIDTMPGEKKDRMLAALVIQVHPDILNERPPLKSENLTVKHEFGRPLKVKTLPEQQTSKQIDDELAHAMNTYLSTTTVSNDFELY